MLSSCKDTVPLSKVHGIAKKRTMKTKVELPSIAPQSLARTMKIYHDRQKKKLSSIPCNDDSIQSLQTSQRRRYMRRGSRAPSMMLQLEAASAVLFASDDIDWTNVTTTLPSIVSTTTPIVPPATLTSLSSHQYERDAHPTFVQLMNQNASSSLTNSQSYPKKTLLASHPYPLSLPCITPNATNKTMMVHRTISATKLLGQHLGESLSLYPPITKPISMLHNATFPVVYNEVEQQGDHDDPESV